MENLLLNSFYEMKAFSLYHLLMITILSLFFIGLAFLLHHKGKKFQKSTLIVLFVILIINYVLFFVLNAFTPLFHSEIRYNPIKWVLKYVLQYMEFLPIIFLGVVIFKKKHNAHFSKMVCFYFLILWGVLGLFVNGTTLNLDATTNYHGIFGGNGGLMMGLLSEEIFINYWIQKSLYIVIPLYMAVFGFYRPQFRDIPKVAISFVGLILIADLFNNFLINAHSNLRLFFVPSALSKFYTNVLYTSSPDGMPLLTWLYNLCNQKEVLYLIPLLVGLIPIWILFTLPFYKPSFFKNLKQNIKNYFLDLKKYWKEVFTRPYNYEEIINNEKDKK